MAAAPRLGRLLEYGRMIKFSHSIFLLPFAISALLMAPSGSLNGGKLLVILIALVSARSAGFVNLRLGVQVPSAALSGVSFHMVWVSILLGNVS